MNGFEVLSPGILTLLEDRGRFGYMSKGITTSGAIDEFAYLWGNHLLDNDLYGNSLEIAFSGLKLKANIDTAVAVTGANLNFSINDKEYKPWQTFNIKCGDILKFSKNIDGQRAYLTVKDAFMIPKEFGSNSTTLKEGLGGIDGKALKKGDFLPCKPCSFYPKKRLKSEYHPDYNQAIVLRVILGYQYKNFSTTQRDKFFNSDFKISREANRMGIKLDGETIKADIDGIISEGICFGAIQIPQDGRPIVLLKDRQTIGGYPKMGTVLNIDCFKLSQLKPNSIVKFEEITMEDALKETKLFYAQLKK